MNLIILQVINSPNIKKFKENINIYIKYYYNIYMNNLINSQNINLNEGDNIYDEMYEVSEREFAQAFQLIQNDRLTELENKKALFYILLNDVTKIDSTKDITLNPSNVLESFYEVIDESIDELEEKISNKNNSHMEEIKKMFKKKKESINKKLKDCNISLKILKKAYLNKNIESYFGNTNTNSLNFKSGNVLYSNDRVKNYKLGEFFGRFIFNSIKQYEDPTVVTNYSQQDFYSQARIESFVTSRGPGLPDEFVDNLDVIDNNFKYWIVLFFLISQIFSEKPDYNKLFKQNSFDKFIEELTKPPKKKNTQTSKQGKKAKKQRGGAKKKISTKGNSIIKGLKKVEAQKSILTKTSPNKVVNPQNIFDEIFDKVSVNNGIMVKNLRNIYYTTFSIKLKDIIKGYIDHPVDNPPNYIYGDPRVANLELAYPSVAFIHPFSKIEKVNLYMISKQTGEHMKKHGVKYEHLDNELQNINWNIFNWLRYISKNKEGINEFIKKVKSRLILLLFYLYNLKKSIYKYFIERLDNLFNLNNVSSNNSNSSNNSVSRGSVSSNKSNSNNIVYNNNTTVKVSKKKSDSGKNKNEGNTNKEITKIQKKINLIKSKKVDINNDEKILILEAKLKQLIIQQLNSQ